MANLKLNSLGENIFDASKGQDMVIKCNNGVTISRNDIVTTGRLLACEYVGTRLNAFDKEQKYNSRLESKDYSTISKAHTDKLLLFCAAQAYRAVGKDIPENIEAVRADAGLAKNSIFLATLAAISRDVIQPLMFRVFDDVSARGLMQWEAVPFGTTKQIDIRSNDVILFEDSAWGSGRSASYNNLYAKSITLNPTMYTAQVKMKWYQLAVNGDAGYWYASIMNGLWNKIYANFVQNLVTAVGNPKFVPANLTATTYSTANWLKLTTLVAAANNVRRTDLVAFGSIEALSNILPTDGTGGAILGLQYGLGEEWFRRGFLPNVGGVQLIEIEPTIVPGTQNSTLDTISLGNSIYITAKAGLGYAPIYGGYYEGTPITLEMTPSETADFTIDLNIGATLDFKPVFGSKVGVITDVVSA